MAEAFGVATMLYLMLLLVWAVIVGAALLIMRAVPGPRWRHPDPARAAGGDRDAEGRWARSQARLESLGGSR